MKVMVSSVRILVFQSTLMSNYLEAKVSYAFSILKTKFGLVLTKARIRQNEKNPVQGINRTDHVINANLQDTVTALVHFAQLDQLLAKTTYVISSKRTEPTIPRQCCNSKNIYIYKQNNTAICFDLVQLCPWVPFAFLSLYNFKQQQCNRFFFGRVSDQYCLQSPSLILKADEFYISLNLVPSSQQQYLAEVGWKNRNHIVQICCSYCGIGYTRFIR